MKRICRECHGHGKIPMDRAALGPITMPETGEVIVPAGTGATITILERCGRCDGDGWVIPKPDPD